MLTACILVTCMVTFANYNVSAGGSIWRVHMKINKTRFWSNANQRGIRAFSYMWSLPITWQRWRSQHSFCHNCKTPCCMQTTWLYVLQNWSYCRLKFYIAGIGIWDLFSPVSLTLTRWSYTKLTRIPSRYTGSVKMNFLRPMFQKLLSDRHTDRQTRPKSYTMPLCRWSVILITKQHAVLLKHTF